MRESRPRCVRVAYDGGGVDGCGGLFTCVGKKMNARPRSGSRDGQGRQTGGSRSASAEAGSLAKLMNWVHVTHQWPLALGI